MRPAFLVLLAGLAGLLARTPALEAGASPASRAHPVPRLLWAQADTGEALFRARCSVCHTDAGTGAAPATSYLRSRTPDAVVTALTAGAMRPMATGLTRTDIHAIAKYLTGRVPGGAAGPASEAGFGAP